MGYLVPDDDAPMLEPAPVRPPFQGARNAGRLLGLALVVGGGLWWYFGGGFSTIAPEFAVLAPAKTLTDFKGLKMGMTVNEARQACPGLKMDKKGGSGTIETDLLDFSVDFSEGKLWRIYSYFNADDFDRMKRIFVEKYGRPTIDTGAVADYGQTKLFWCGSGITLKLSRFSEYTNYWDTSKHPPLQYDFKRGSIAVYEPASPEDIKRASDGEKHSLD